MSHIHKATQLAREIEKKIEKTEKVLLVPSRVFNFYALVAGLTWGVIIALIFVWIDLNKLHLIPWGNQ